ncbi:hypothetical protein EV426DRAFT_623446 [Tirmania nivea]|nr:hypothetical protein EV426DRAFT_623446 [Tirmania nivea]
MSSSLALPLMLSVLALRNSLSISFFLALSVSAVTPLRCSSQHSSFQASLWPMLRAKEAIEFNDATDPLRRRPAVASSCPSCSCIWTS